MRLVSHRWKAAVSLHGRGRWRRRRRPVDTSGDQENCRDEEDLHELSLEKDCLGGLEAAKGFVTPVCAGKSAFLRSGALQRTQLMDDKPALASDTSTQGRLTPRDRFQASLSHFDLSFVSHSLPPPPHSLSLCFTLSPLAGCQCFVSSWRDKMEEIIKSWSLAKAPFGLIILVRQTPEALAAILQQTLGLGLLTSCCINSASGRQRS